MFLLEKKKVKGFEGFQGFFKYIFYWGGGTK